MTTAVRAEEAAAQDVAVTIVDTDVHPLPVSGDCLGTETEAGLKAGAGRLARVQ